MPIPDEILTTAYNEKTESWRIKRLERAIGYIQACIDRDGDGQFLNKIKELHDHKGVLTVRWKKEPTSLEKKFFNKAWLSAIGDGDDNVEHEIV